MEGYLGSRLEFLRASQNSDGGWGYLRGRQSWLEPTVFAMLALRDDPEARRQLDLGWRLIRAWQLPDGAWRPCAEIRRPHWTTALCVSLHCEAGIVDAGFRRGVDWLIETRGAEQGVIMRLANFLNPKIVEFNPGLSGWPWLPGTASWIEPTAHTLIALQSASAHLKSDRLRERVDMGRRMLLERRCRDGGWNYGNRRVLGADLYAFAEDTALALLALRGYRWPDAERSLELARKFRSESRSRLAQAWLGICLNAWGMPRELPEDAGCRDDVYVSALEALACRPAA